MTAAHGFACHICREYVPGGYFWGRVLFVGNDQRIENLGMG